MWSVNPLGVEICNGLDDDCDGLVDSDDAWGDNSDDLASLVSNCDTYASVIAGNIGEFRNEYVQNDGDPTVDSFPHTVQAGGHAADVSLPDDAPADCSNYFEVSYLLGPDPDTGETTTRSFRLCFSKGLVDDPSDDSVWAALEVEQLKSEFTGTLDNSDDGDGLAGVRYAAEESTADTEVWYVSDSFTTSGTIAGGTISYTSTITLEDARFVIHIRQ